MLIKQGDILIVNLNPTKGHEQKKTRPVLVVSNEVFNQNSNIILVCPISHSDNNYPCHVKLPDNGSTTGSILCDQIRALDINARGYKYVNSVSNSILKKVIRIIKLIISEETIE